MSSPQPPSSAGKGRPSGQAPPPPPRQRGPGGGGPAGALARPTEKAKDFRGTLKRIVGMLRPERARIVVVLLLAVVSVTLAVLGPKILGNAMNILYEGVASKQLPAGVTQAQAVAGLKLRGESTLAKMLSAMHLTPGHGVDFGALGRTLLVLVGIYVVSALFGWGQQYIMAGAAQRTMFRLRRDVDLKLARLPLRYFDDHSRGDVLSRMTNDIDNISQSLQ